MAWRLGIDVGGTFTDLVALDVASGRLVRNKVASTPTAPQDGVLAALRAFVESESDDIAFIAHSTTIATNALLGQVNLALPRVAFITTEGFRDVLEIGRQNRSEVYNLFLRRPRPLVPREDRLVVRERIGPDGDVLVPLDRASLDAALAIVRERNIVDVAIGFLNSYRNDAHERAVAEAVAEAIPGARVSRSAEVNPEYREYERFSTCVVNASLVPIVRTYLLQLERDVRALGISAPIYIMQSSGGMASIDAVAERPAALVESGPASGVIGAAHLGRALGTQNVLSFDMGGTTAKAGTIVGGRVEVIGEFEAAGSTHSGRSIKGSGYPVRFPFVDLAEVSAGGGTIAAIDTAGSLRVGPLSAGADPGPAAYGKGDRATVTDANVVLGRLNPIALLGGDFPIHADRADAAIDALAERLTPLDRERVATGIIAIVDAEMAKVLRIVSVERGYDPRDFTLVAFGGGGPLHACALADELGMHRVVIPPLPGVFSAYGLLVAELRSTFAAPIAGTRAAVDERELRRTFEALEARGARELEAQGVTPAGWRFVRECDARYLGQSFEIAIPFTSLDELPAAFHDAHERRYGYAAREDVVELVTARVDATGTIPSVETAEQRMHATGRDGAESSGRRRVWFEGGFTDVEVWKRETIGRETVLDGPCVIEQYDTTTIVSPRWRVRVDDANNMVLERGT